MHLIMKRLMQSAAVLAAAVFVAGCGGGSPSGTGSGGGTGGSGGPGSGATPTYTISIEVQRSGTSTTQITSTETVQAVATVLANGAPLEGVVVTFGETGPSLLKYAPASATALTLSDGKAKIDLSAATAAATGATSVTASANVGQNSILGSRSVSISAGAVSATPPVPAAMTFVGSAPSGVAIVVKGAGGTGRAESAILTFRIVDANNAPIADAQVDFTLDVGNGGALIEPTSTKSNSSGLVSTTVSSGIRPGSIVVTASANSNPAVRTQSDTLIVSNSVAVAEGFEIVAEKRNLDGRHTGDSTTITAYVRDAFGNPVPDGVAVNFQTDYGVVGSSTQGGCTTVNGTCTVDFRVQDPRGAGVATVIGQVTVSGVEEPFADSLQINMAAATGGPYLAIGADGVPVETLTLNSCTQAFELRLSDGSTPYRSVAAGTTIKPSFSSSGVTVSMRSGSPVLDQVTSTFAPTDFGIEIALALPLAPACSATGTVGASEAFLRLEFTTPNNITYTQRIALRYPQ